MGLIIAITGPSGIGKGFIKKIIKLRWPFIYEPSWHTTRKERINDEDGRIFLCERDFIRMQKNKEFLFVDDYCGCRYGLSVKNLYSNNFIITELRKFDFLNSFIKDDIFSIGLVPETLDFLEHRLKGRGTESIELIKDRIEIAKTEIKELKKNQNLFSFFMTINKENEKKVANQICYSLSSILKEAKNEKS